MRKVPIFYKMEHYKVETFIQTTAPLRSEQKFELSEPYLSNKLRKVIK